MTYDDNSSADNCQCDGADDAMYTCEYHQDQPEFSYGLAVERFVYWLAVERFVYRANDDLVDAYGPGHYKTGVYDVC